MRRGTCKTEGLGEAGEKRDMQDRRIGRGEKRDMQDRRIGRGEKRDMQDRRIGRGEKRDMLDQGRPGSNLLTLTMP